MIRKAAQGLIALLTLAAPAMAAFEWVAVAPVWSGHPVNFAIETVDDLQYVAFYDAERRMTVAQRSLDSTEWRFERLPSVLGWDSHSDVVLAVDRAGYVHVSGNMHGQKLVYFRSAEPHDISVFEAPGMVGTLERRVSYPVFLRGPEGRLFFQYRDGKSGDGVQIVNAYDVATRSWRRLVSQPLFDGGGEQSAYLAGPVLGPDGRFHLVWMWRDTPSGATNHDISYARSADLLSWESADGRPLELPLRPGLSEAIVDPVASGGGLAGIAFGAGWDSRQRPLVTYSKYDAAGRSQSYTARHDDGWTIHQISDWEFRWDLDRTGTLPETISVRPPRGEGGRLVQEFRHQMHGTGVWVLDEETLQIASVEPLRDELRELRTPRSKVPGMEVRELIHDRRGEYFLRWETLPPNRDKKHKPPYPQPTMLHVLRRSEGGSGASADRVAPDRLAPSPALDPLRLEAEGARIGDITLNVGAVFDESDPTENRKVFRLINRLRRRTRPRVIRNELLFETGDEFSQRLVEESERLLRAKKYLYDAQIVPVAYRAAPGEAEGTNGAGAGGDAAEGAVVDLDVNTRDVWTLGGGVSFARSGGENSTRVEVDDTNFLGTGTELAVSYGSDVERTTTEVRYRNSNLQGKRARVEISLRENSDGHRRLVRLEQPFYALDTKRSRGVTIIDETRIDPLFDLGQVTSEFRHDIEFFDLQWGLSKGLRNRQAKRWLFGVTYSRDTFSELPGQPPAGELPPDRTLAFPSIGFEWVQDRFIEERDLDKIAKTEDVNLGAQLNFRLGLSAPLFGADRTQALFGFEASSGLRPGGGGRLVFFSAEGGTRYSDDGFENASLSGSLRFFRRNRGNSAFFAELQAAAVENLDAEEQLLLGGDSGLRGYPLRFQSGDRRILLTLEHRLYTSREILKLATLGAAVFLDAGRAWFTGDSTTSDLGVLTDVGFGLRFTPTRSGRSSVLHVDVAFPLDANGSVDSIQYLVSAKETL